MSVNTPVGTSERQLYRFVQAGGGVVELGRIEVREFIRSGVIDPATALSPSGADDWRPAASYPELGRYLEMAAVRPRASLTPTAKPREVGPMSERIVSGLSYPLSGGEVITILGLSILSVIPFIGMLASLASTVIMLAIIRKSADGSLKMPPLVETTDVSGMIRLYLRVLFVTAVSLIPVMLFAGYSIRGLFLGTVSGTTAMVGIVVGLAFAMIYYPACLATIAVWDNVISALNPVYVARVIRTIGIDYFLVIGIWFAATVLTTLLTFPRFSPLAMIPIVGGVLSSALSLWVLFSPHTFSDTRSTGTLPNWAGSSGSCSQTTREGTLERLGRAGTTGAHPQ